MKAHFSYEIQMDLHTAFFICESLGLTPYWKNDDFIITPAEEDEEAYAQVSWSHKSEMSFEQFLSIAEIAMRRSKHRWTQFNTKFHMDDKGVSAWDVISKNKYHSSEGFYNSKSLGISSHEKLERIKEIINEQ